MTDHWQTIEDALETVLAEFYYEEEQEKTIDAALAFVREQRAATVQGQPQLDWDKAPAWAMWWAQDSDGQTFWYENKPGYSMNGRRWWPSDGKYNDTTKPCSNWRTTLTQRPQPADAKEGGGDD